MSKVLKLWSVRGDYALAVVAAENELQVLELMKNEYGYENDDGTREELDYPWEDCQPYPKGDEETGVQVHVIVSKPQIIEVCTA